MAFRPTELARFSLFQACEPTLLSRRKRGRHESRALFVRQERRTSHAEVHAAPGLSVGRRGNLGGRYPKADVPPDRVARDGRVADRAAERPRESESHPTYLWDAHL